MSSEETHLLATEEEDDEQQHVQHLSDHTISIRKAIRYVSQSTYWKKKRERQHPHDGGGPNEERTRLSSLSLQSNHLWKDGATRELWPLSSPSTMTDDLHHHRYQIPILDLCEHYDASADEDGDDEPKHDFASSPRFFRIQYLETNQPCLLRGLSPQYFGGVDRCWRQLLSTRNEHDAPPSSLLSNTDDTTAVPKWRVNYDWFRQHVGTAQLVPLRVSEKMAANDLHFTTTTPPSTFQQHNNNKTPDLDDMGRAKECPTRQVTLEQWIHMLQEPSQEEAASSSNSYYLKDWHLQLQLEQPQHDDDYEHTLTHSRIMNTPDSPLYQVPPHFEHDLLNHFLLQFCNCKSDYRFCYWGPQHSYTSWHTDVLQSYSWSYNVVGRKHWTFRVPSPTTHPDPTIIVTNNTTSETTTDLLSNTSSSLSSSAAASRIISIIQEAGDCIFVPSQWQHYVINLEETLSVNHNWITTANLPACWECILQELYAVREEMKAWEQDEAVANTGNNGGNSWTRFGDKHPPMNRVLTETSSWDWEAQENMLRGCVGLDVTTFVWMILTRLVDLLVSEEAEKPTQDNRSTTEAGNLSSYCKGTQPLPVPDQRGPPTTDRSKCLDEIEHDVQFYDDTLDMMRLATMLQTVWNHPEANAKQRLTAIVKDSSLSSIGIYLINEILADVLDSPYLLELMMDFSGAVVLSKCSSQSKSCPLLKPAGEDWRL